MIICVCIFCWKVFDGWILKGEKFPSSQDHPLPTSERYIDFCESGLSRRSIRSSQNVAMIFFRVHEPGNGFTLTIQTDPNLFRKWLPVFPVRRQDVWGRVSNLLFKGSTMHRLKKFEVKKDLNGNIFVIRNDVKGEFPVWFSDNESD